MLFITYLRVLGAMIDFKKKYPNTVFKKENKITTLFNILKVNILFIIPILNIVIFLYILLFISDEILENSIKKCVKTIDKQIDP